MGRHTLPCVVCNAEVENVEDSFENSPYGATVFMTHGHYGSTIFDPVFSGCYLELNICDECIARLGKEGKILMGQDKKAVTYEGSVIGHTPVDRELVTWHEGLEEEGRKDMLSLDRDDLEHPERFPEITFTVSLKNLLAVEDKMCTCGHTDYWHADRGKGLCEGDGTCECKRFEAIP